MSEEEEIARGSALLWRDMVAKALEDRWMPVALVGAIRSGEGYQATLARANTLPKATLLHVLCQIVSALEREEQGNGQRVSCGTSQKGSGHRG